MADIFLSYAKEDRARASRFAAAFSKHGWSVFWDPLIPTGKPFDLIIASELEAARCVVVLWSQYSIKSNWVKDEAREGEHRGILHPVLIDDVKPPLGFRSLQYADLRGPGDHPPHEIFDKLIRDIAETLKAEPSGLLRSGQDLRPRTQQVIRYVDVQKVLVRSQAGMAARRELETAKATMQRELDERRTELETMSAELTREVSDPTTVARGEKQMEFERKRVEATRLTDDFRKRLEGQEQELLRDVLSGITAVIERLGRERGYGLILERRGSSVVYGTASADVTDDVVALLDRETEKTGADR